MTGDHLIELIDDLRKVAGEPAWLEFKVNNSDHKKIGELISGISNAARLHDKSCGFVVWGIEDADHNVVGTTFLPATQKVGNENLEFWLAKKITPALNIQFKESSSSSRAHLPA